MLKPINSIIGDSISNVIYRGNIVTGIVATNNSDGSYNVFISESGKAYPKIFTLSRNPNLVVGDKVRILYENGNKELPIILPPVTPTVTIPLRFALIVASPNEIQLFNMDGNLTKQLSFSGLSYAEAGITIDSQGNIYTKEWEVIKKYDSNLNLLKTHNISEDTDQDHYYISDIKIGPDGYLYTLENTFNGDYVYRRDSITLEIIDSCSGLGASGMTTFCLNLEENILSGEIEIHFYVYDSPYIRKYVFSSGNLLASEYVGSLSNEYAGCAVLGSYVYFVKDTNEVMYLPLDLSAHTIWNMPSNIAYALTVADSHLIISGWDGAGDGATSKYDSGRNLIWTEKLTAAAYAYKAGGYNF